MILLWLLPFAAPAQMGMEIFNAANQSATEFSGVVAVNSAISVQMGQRSAGEFSGVAVPGTALRSLGYSPSRDVSLRTRRQLENKLLDHSRDPAVQAEIRKVMSSDAVWREFERLLSSFGYSSRNLADVMTGYYVINWEVVNGSDASGNADGIRAVRQQLAAALAANGKVASLSDADKQQSAEVMGTFAALAGAIKNDCLQRGDSAGLQRLQEMVHRSVLSQGVDLKRLRLTSQGFIR